MVHINGNYTRTSDPNLCNYCYQRPKFPPYDYCGRACGALARAARNGAPGSAVMCKRCNQRPVYRNYQFCGKSCAGAWKATHGQDRQVVQRGGRPGQMQGLGGIRGFVQGFKDLVSPNNPTQQQMTTTNPPQPQQFFITITNPISNTGTSATVSPTTMISPTTSNHFSPGTSQHPYNLPYPTPGGTLNQNHNNKVDPFNGAYPISSAHIQPYSSERSFPKIPKNTNLDPVWNGTSPPPYSIEDTGYQCKDGGERADEVFVGSRTDSESNYRSQEHQANLMASAQAGPCIMCCRVPKRPNDHFCSEGCRMRALAP